MNPFRLCGDLCHVLAIIILLMKIWRTKSCSGISGKSQLLYAVVFTTRYLDLFTVFISVYNVVMKVIFLATTYGTAYLIYVTFKETYDRKNDSLRIEFLILPCFILAVTVNYSFTLIEILWTFSIYLEAVAILPQLFMIAKTGETELIPYHYLFALGLYRALYLLNWIYRYYVENHYDLISIAAGVVQTIIYCDFFYLYVSSRFQEKLIDIETVK